MDKLQVAHAESVKQSAARELALQEKLNGYVHKEDLREFREEIRDNFKGVFNRMDQMADRLQSKG
jgi:hypothetical protein